MVRRTSSGAPPPVRCPYFTDLKFKSILSYHQWVKVTQKIQLEEKDLDFIEAVFSILDYKTKSEYMREAILAKIHDDKKKLREMKCREAMEAYGEETTDNVFESIEADDFEDR